MAEIKLIDESTDLSHLRKPYAWDLEINDKEYDIYRVEGYCHTIGGKMGENDLWACPRGNIPSYDNLIEFNGDAPTWGVIFNRKNYIKTKYDETSVEANGSCWITRNNKNFYRIPARYMDYGLAKAQHVLVRLLEECPLNLSERDWQKDAIGRCVWYHEQPAIIASITSDNELWLKPDGVPFFKAPAYWEGEYDDYTDGLIVDLLSPYVHWFR